MRERHDPMLPMLRWRDSDGRVVVGVLEGDQARPAAPEEVPPGLRAVIPGETHRPGPGVASKPVRELELVAPLIPGKIICVGLNYRDHAEETGLAIPEMPLLFAKLPSAVTGPHSDIEVLPETTQLDYEVELGVVIGSAGRRIEAAEARGHVVGVLTANDVSARDAQFSDGQWLRGKSFDTFAPMGPWLTPLTADVALDDLVVRSWVNGELRQESSTRHLIFGVEQLIAYASHFFTLLPGDVILTGTPGGVGMGFDPPRYLGPGDVVEAEVEGLGRLCNTVVPAVIDAPDPGTEATDTGSSVSARPGDLTGEPV